MHTDVAILRKIELFSGLPDDKLDWLLHTADELTLKPGDVLIEEGTGGDAMFVVVDGQYDILKQSGGKEIFLGTRGPGEMLGEMALIGNEPRSATVRASTPSHLLRITRGSFEDLLCGNPSTAMTILRTIMIRMRNTEAMLRQNEKLISLGTLSAGLAHELNNPAAAARRSADQLRDTINQWLQARSDLDALHLTPTINALVMNRLRDDIKRSTTGQAGPEGLERSDREAEIEDWLTDHDIDNAWETAPILVQFGWIRDDLDAWCARLTPEHIKPVIAWLATGYLVNSLLEEVSSSTGRISEIVKSVKDYSHLDQAPRKAIKVEDGLESTLVILKHKIKQGITVVRNYGSEVPQIDAYPGELNQVWTNLMDNAIDAMGGRGVLRLTTRLDGDRVIIEIADNGPGIPPDVLPRIFDAFFTTKGPGSGTGLGLHISHNIIDKHRGDIEVTSVPGDTRFIVSLPVSSP